MLALAEGWMEPLTTLFPNTAAVVTFDLFALVEHTYIGVDVPVERGHNGFVDVERTNVYNERRAPRYSLRYRWTTPGPFVHTGNSTVCVQKALHTHACITHSECTKLDGKN